MTSRRTKPARARGRVVIASYGFGPRQMTLETLVALRQCDAVYSNAVAADSPTLSMLRELGLKIEIVEGASNDARTTDAVLALARRSKAAAYLTYGDPLFRNSLSPRLLEACRKEGLPVQVFHGVSSLNIILGRLPIANIGPAGFYVCTADGFPFLSPDVPALVFSLRNSPAETIERFAAAVRRIYPAGHRVETIECRFDPDMSLKRRKYPVRALGKALSDIPDAATLYIPSVARRAAAPSLKVRR